MLFGELYDKVEPRFDVKALFSERTGLSLNAYLDMNFAVLIHYFAKDQQELIRDPQNAVLNPDTFFNIAPAADIRRFWEKEMATFEQYIESLGQAPSNLKPQHDFIAFRRKPILEIRKGLAICLNPGFVQEKLESGLFWSVFNSLGSDADRNALFETWGKLFEQYVTFLFSRALDGESEQYIPFPRFTDNSEEAFDGVIVSGKICLVMEYKAGFLRADAKYAEDEDRFVQDVNLKFGRSRGAGVEQLARKIGRAFHVRDYRRRAVQGLDVSGIATVVPVMVVQDPFISSYLTSFYLCGEFRSAMQAQELSRRTTCTGLQLLHVADIETLRPYVASKQCSVADCIMGRARLGDKAPAFDDYFIQFSRERDLKPALDSEFEQRARAIFDRVSRRFFGRALETGLPATGQ